MGELFPLKAKITAEQQDILNSNPNLIISGAAGTGKTFLTILLAEKLNANHPNSTVAIVILTKSLKKFIKDSLMERNIERTNVIYQYEWNASPALYDFIIIDEAQDFTLKQIINIKTFCKKGIYILGDTNQRILDRNLNEKTATMEEISSGLGLPQKLLIENLRFHEGIKNFICDAYPKIKITTAINSGKTKPQIIKCTSKEDELNKIVDLLNGNTLRGKIGILAHTNDQVLEIIRSLQGKGINKFGFKHNHEEKLLFVDDVANILTYHSSKGLEFDCVLLPFLSVGLGIPNLYYVAFSRAKEKLILFYSTSFTPELKIPNASLYEGIIERPFLIEEAEPNISLYNTLLKAAKNTKDQFYIAQIKEENKEMVIEAIEQLRDAGLSEEAIKTYFENDEDIPL